MSHPAHPLHPRAISLDTIEERTNICVYNALLQTTMFEGRIISGVYGGDRNGLTITAIRHGAFRAEPFKLANIGIVPYISPETGKYLWEWRTVTVLEGDLEHLLSERHRLYDKARELEEAHGTISQLISHTSYVGTAQ